MIIDFTYDEVWPGYTEEDMRTMEIEEILAAYDSAKRERLQVHLTGLVNSTTMTDKQKEKALGYLDAAFLNVQNSDIIKNDRLEDDIAAIVCRLDSIVGIRGAVSSVLEKVNDTRN